MADGRVKISLRMASCACGIIEEAHIGRECQCGRPVVARSRDRGREIPVSQRSASQHRLRLVFHHRLLAAGTGGKDILQTENICHCKAQLVVAGIYSPVRIDHGLIGYTHIIDGCADSCAERKITAKVFVQDSEHIPISDLVFAARPDKTAIEICECCIGAGIITAFIFIYCLIIITTGLNGEPRSESVYFKASEVKARSRPSVLAFLSSIQ